MKIAVFDDPTRIVMSVKKPIIRMHTVPRAWRIHTAFLEALHNTLPKQAGEAYQMPA